MTSMTRSRYHRSLVTGSHTGIFGCILLLVALFSSSSNNNNNGGTLPLVWFADASPGMVKADDTDARPRVLPAKELVTMTTYMRHDEYRLVRSSTEQSLEQQHLYCPYKIPALLMTLCTNTAGGSSSSTSKGQVSVSLHTRGLAAEALTLCLMDQPEFRQLAYNNSSFLTTSNDNNNHNSLSQTQQKQLVAHSMAEGLVVLFQQAMDHYFGEDADPTARSTALTAMAQAAETMWTAATHHEGLLADLIQAGAVDVLGAWIVQASADYSSEDNTAYPFAPARSIMWACAALQNMATSYCDNALGSCIWNWQEKDTTTTNDNGETNDSEDTTTTTTRKQHLILTLDENTPTVLAPQLVEQVRERIVHYPQLLATLVEWVCRGPVRQKHSDQHAWPGEATLWTDETLNAASPHVQSPSIVPWAAAGVLQQLLVSSNSNVVATLKASPKVQQCLCDMVWSPDWLEHGKAATAVYLWAPPDYAVSHSSSNCPDIYESCQDDYEWRNAETGDTCEQYTIERWCIEYGEDVNEHGKTANEACCLCGGGSDVQLPDFANKKLAKENTDKSDEF